MPKNNSKKIKQVEGQILMEMDLALCGARYERIFPKDARISHRTLINLNLDILDLTSDNFTHRANVTHWKGK